ncbi:hypothetical protein V474_20850 [Novosphingobium barchaimii LL02]|uniref:Uncharacterized protein n=2 Tax=Novosphingobium barchaimii TaxID=1420591 RepID=A0A0J7XGS0_9SPHN|nr:hypothetical protein V474_12625 [Novosphingobium barchaimii LL02]KMS54428.1 hypothetical protein V474_20850 [Novosphingobium barchaimii LL02]
MKSLWYYQPEHATMWDSYAVMALNDVMGAKHRNGIKEEKAATAFLHDFEALHARWLPTIEANIAAQAPLLGMTYPYTRRVLDKALWLLGKRLDRKIPKGEIKASADSQPDVFMMVLADYNPKLREATEDRFDLT